MIISEGSRLNDRKRRAIARLIVGFQGLEPSRDLYTVLGNHSPAGVILFARNIEEKAQVQQCNRMLGQLWSRDETPWISLDQEGGRVRRIKEIPWPKMRHLGQLNDIDLTKRLVKALNSEVREWGFNGNWAPCADVDSNPDIPVIGDRSFSRDPHQCAEQVIAAMEAMREVGVLPCIKHFPGHGDTDMDSHLDLPWVHKSSSELASCEWIPFQKAIQAQTEVIMTAHVMFPELDSEFPATMSKVILEDLLRIKFEYSGVIVSDDMEMKAVRGRFPVQDQMDYAVRAGVDAFLVCSDAELQMECIEALVKLQEQDAEHEALAERSLQRLHHLQLHRQELSSINPIVGIPDKWHQLCAEINQRTEFATG